MEDERDNARGNPSQAIEALEPLPGGDGGPFRDPRLRQIYG